MNINVRVLAANARKQIAALQAQVRGLQAQSAGAAAATSGIGGGKARKSMGAFGNQVQWTGRQLQYNWTLPLALAGGAAMKFALDNEKAMTRVSKVYGDAADAQAYYMKQGMSAGEAQSTVTKVFEDELNSLGRAFEALSSHYGVQQKEVIETAGAWAAAGASGLALAESTELSLKAAVLGDMELAKATESLIAIQSQYSLSTKGLNLTLAELNAIENQTGISMQGLIEGFARSAGVAREAGIDVRHLGAMLAALVPASGTAANAGNSLKTIISRLMAPTQDAAAVMKEFGVDTADASWQGMTAMERLLVVAGKMKRDLKETGKSTKDLADDGYELSDSQKQVVATVLGSRYQMNRFLVLMRELGEENGYYSKALNATKNDEKVFTQATKELNKVLDSNPKKLEIMWYTMQNGLATAIQPLIPYLLYMAGLVAKIATAFGNLDPSFQKFILLTLLAVAAVGPVVKMFGSFLTLIYMIGAPLRLLTGLWAAHTAKVAATAAATGTARLGIIGFLKMLVVGPVRAFAISLGWVIGALGLWPRMFAAVRSAMVAWVAVTVAGPAVVAAGWTTIVTALRARMVVIWGSMFAGMVAIQTAGILVMLRTWVGGLATMSAATGASTFAARFMFMLGLMQFALKRSMILMLSTLAAGLGRMVMAIIAFGAATNGLWGVIWMNMLHTFHVFGQAMLQGMAYLRAGVGVAWMVLHMRLAAISKAAWVALIGLASKGSGAVGFVTAASGRLMVPVWAAIHAAMALLSATFWRTIIGLYIAGTVRILALAKKWLSIRVIMFQLVMAARLFGPMLLKALANPYVLAAVAVIGILVMFRKQIGQVWNNIVAYFSDSSNAVVKGIINAWNMLPKGVANALTAVARIVQQAAMQIYEWFSYINPFARHSPSLVENVTNGMNEVGKQFGKLDSIGGHVKGAYRQIAAFGRATAGLMRNAGDVEIAQKRAQVKKFAPGALGGFNALVGTLRSLKRDLAGIEGPMNRQQGIVDGWQKKVDSANRSLDIQQKVLDRLTATQTRWSDALTDAQDRLSELTSAPLEGMGAMSDAIFENEMAQKRLRLEMMKLSDAGESMDDIKSKIDAITGAQELLSGERSRLQSGGAGSDITKTYDDQLAALEKQKKGYQDATAPLQNMQDQLKALEAQGERLDLTNSLQFDPLTRQIEKAASSLKEMPFNEVMTGVRGAQREIANYSDELAAATRAVDKQQAVVDSFTATRDRYQDSLDAEEYKLKQIKDRYDEVADAINAVESAMNSATGASDTLKNAKDAAKAKKKSKGGLDKAEYVSPAVQNFRDAAGGNFANVGGAGIPMRKDWGSEAGDIDQWVKDQLGDTGKLFEKIDMFGGLKKKWNQFQGWMSARWADFKRIGGEFMGAAFKDVDFGQGKAGSAMDKLRVLGAKTSDFLYEAGQKVKRFWEHFWPIIAEGARNTWSALKSNFDSIKEELDKLSTDIGGSGDFFKDLWKVVKVVLAAIAAAFALLAFIIANVFASVIKPAIKMFGALIKGVIRIVRGVVQILTGFWDIVSGDAEGGLKKMVSGVVNILAGLGGAIWGVLKGVVKIVVGIFVGVAKGVWDWMKWLWDELVGHSIIPDIVDGIKFWFGKLASIPIWVYTHMILPVIRFFVALFTRVIAGAKLFWAGIKLAWAGLKTAGKWIWNNTGVPIINGFKKIWNLVKAGLRLWWTGIKAVWGALKGAGAWVWNNMLAPVLQRVRNVWSNHVRPELGKWWGRIKGVWSSLKGLGGWIKTNVMDPVFNKIKGGWNAVKDWLTRSKGMLTNPVKGIVNAVIDGVNRLIRGLNKISDILPGINFSISPIVKLAQGTDQIPTRRVGGGFKTNGARAIVGEGKANYPEFVIPTDPTHRKRARSLLGMAASKLGGPVAGDVKNSRQVVHGTPAYAIGGWIGDLTKDAWKGVKKLAKNTVSMGYKPVDMAARAAINQVGWQPPKSLATHGANQMKEWVTQSNDDFEKARAKAKKKYDTPVGGNVSVNDPTNPRGISSYHGGTFSNRFIAHLKAAEKIAGQSIHVTQGGWRPATSYSGTSHAGDALDTTTGNNIITALRRVGIAAGDRTGLGSWAPHTHAIPGPSAGYAGGSGVWQWSDYMNRGGMNQGFTSPWGLKEGGVALASRGPTLAAIGDGRYDEAVVPLPNGWRNGVIGGSGGDTIININAPLEFPNIKSGSDVEELVENLKALGGS